MTTKREEKLERELKSCRQELRQEKLYVHCRLGLRTTRDMLIYLNKRLEWNLPKIPCHTSIKNWVEKSGYAIYKEPQSEE